MRRLETGSLVAALGAGLLVVSLFLQWYEPDLTAWDAFEVWDLVLAGLGLSVLATVAAELGWWRGPVPKLEILLAGGAAAVIVAAALLSHPPAAIGRGVKDGAWLGLAGAVLMAGGGVMARFGISLALSVEPRPERPVRGPGGAARVPGGGDAPPAPEAGGRGPAARPVAGRPVADPGEPAPRPVRIPGSAPAPAPAPAPSPRRAPVPRQQGPPSAGGDDERPARPRGLFGVRPDDAPPPRAARRGPGPEPSPAPGAEPAPRPRGARGAPGGDLVAPRPRGVPADEPPPGGRRWLPRRRAAPAWDSDTDDTRPLPDQTDATRVLPEDPDPPRRR